MPFDPALPADTAPLISPVIRAQLNGLKALIDAILALIAQVDGVNTLPPGNPASATVSVTGQTLHFTFAIPQGDTGSQGGEGAAGPPFAQAIVDSVTTLDPGNPATVAVSFDGSYVHFTFGIPRGDTGSPGSQGSPGEVNTAQMDNAIAGAIASTARNPAGVAPMNISFNKPPTAADLAQVQAKFNEMLAAATRNP